MKERGISLWLLLGINYPNIPDRRGTQKVAFFTYVFFFTPFNVVCYNTSFENLGSKPPPAALKVQGQGGIPHYFYIGPSAGECVVSYFDSQA